MKSRPVNRRACDPARWSIAALLALLVVGCSGVRTYSSHLPANLHIETRVDSGARFSRTVAELDVHRVDRNCDSTYLGRIDLDRPATAVGIPVNETLFLDFIFVSKGFLSTSVSGTRYTTLLTTRAGHDYQAQVNYEKGIYDVAIREVRRGHSTGRVLARRPASSCRAKPDAGR